MNNPNLILFEDSIFLEEGFAKTIEQLFRNQEIEVAMDSSLKQRIIDVAQTNDLLTAEILTAYLSLIEEEVQTTFLDISGYLDFTEITNIALEKKYETIKLITNKRNIAESFQKQMINYPQAKALQFQSEQLLEWAFQRKSHQKAFFLDNDHYHDVVDIENITSVYSPKYGHLLLDTSSKLKGGEGYVYHSYHNLMCKLFRGHHQNYFNHKKILDMLSIEINNKYIIWPKDVVYYENTFVGFVMDEVKGSVTLDDLRDNGFAGFNVLDRFKLALEFLKHVHYLHQKNIVIGDIKLPNVLVKGPEELYIIDTGSFQVFDYPCTVFTKEYTNKIYTSDMLKKELREVEDEYYAVNKVIFEIMMLKGPHYSPNNLEIDLDSVVRPFTYKLKSPKSMEGLFPHEITWFALSERMREYFYYYFEKGTITYLEDWIQELSSFIRQVEATI
jgi:hypothetical protein